MSKNQLLWLAVAMPFSSTALALDYNFYGSIRVHSEAVNPDDTSVLDSYNSWRDAYSRLGVKANHALNEATSLFAQLELPLDIPNRAVQDPWAQDQDIRIAKAGVKGAFGTVEIGQMWMPYYNVVAYPVDMFSTYYSGFATFTTFRKGDTVAYSSPLFSGIGLSGAWSDGNGANGDDRAQLAASYGLEGLTLAAGMDNLGGNANQTIYGLSLAWNLGEWYVGAKYERFSSDLDTGYGADGHAAKNAYVGYTLGKNTFKLMLADVDDYGENILHVGWDYQFTDTLKFFAEYYSEEETAAITAKHGGFNETAWGASGGNVIAAGLRYDFSSD